MMLIIAGLGLVVTVYAASSLLRSTLSNVPAHGFRCWTEGHVHCRCGWQSPDSFRDGIDQLRVHEQHYRER